MQDQWWNAKADEIPGYSDSHVTKDFCAALKDVYGPTHTTTVPLKGTDSLTVITDKREIFQRWQQHFSALLNTQSNITDEELVRLVDQPTYIDNMDEAPSLDEVSTAISAMKNHKTPRSEGIPAEIFKYGGEILLR
ncbi:unnamed protein product [Caretta caretta]